MKKILVVEEDAAIAVVGRDYWVADGVVVLISAEGEAEKRPATTEDYELFVVDVVLSGAD